jgi:hypothetical protein
MTDNIMLSDADACSACDLHDRFYNGYIVGIAMFPLQK